MCTQANEVIPALLNGSINMKLPSSVQKTALSYSKLACKMFIRLLLWYCCDGGNVVRQEQPSNGHEYVPSLRAVKRKALESPPVAPSFIDALALSIELRCCRKSGGRLAEMLDKWVFSSGARSGGNGGNVFPSGSHPEAEKVSVTNMYLIRDAKLWLRTRLSEDTSVNRDRIKTWDVLKKGLKDQFLPCNTLWLARESLRKLKHSGIVRDYVKEFN
ncbi:UNVERIFIED_CONTAM: hypothetical protein Scaly_1503200 [Sesamum calycinum]|uniref:Retrotransposon gag domain-containing protein n=1 Tax=Sesamum calycinum TaxID=2727403 RepID=A0AAW2PPT0_9LAMI